MKDNKITEAIKMIGGQDEKGIEVVTPPNNIVFDPATPPVRSIVRVVLVTLLILGIAGFLTNIISALTHLFFLVVLAVFFAYLIKPLVELIRKPFNNSQYSKFMPRAAAIGLSYLLVFLIFGIGIAVLAPLVVEQSKQFAVNVPEYTKSIQEKFRDLGTRYRRYQIPEAVQTEINTKAAEIAGAIGSQVTSILINLVYYLPWLVLIPILAFFLLKDANLFRLSLLRILPSGNWRTRAEALTHDINSTLAAYVRAQLISCFLIGSLCTVAFYVLGINYALLLGVMAAIFEFVPLIGPLTLAAIVIIVASLESASEAAYVAVFLGILRILQDYVFYPRIVREGIHLHPLAIILSVLAGEQVAGIPGVFISIPIVALLTVLYKHIMEHSGNMGLVAMFAPPDNSEKL